MPVRRLGTVPRRFDSVSFAPGFPEGLAAPHPKLIPPVDADVHVQTKALQEAIALFTSAAGPFPGHPLLGALSKEEWSQFHCIHCAHHLGFAAPLPAEAGSTLGPPILHEPAAE